MTSAAQSPTRSGRIDPDLALRPGRADAIIVLVLWACRRAFAPLLLLGAVAAVLANQYRPETVAELNSPGELLAALVSPLAGIALALLMRIGVTFVALAAAWPLSTWDRPADAPRDSFQRLHDLVDRWRLAQAYRSLRWTWGVRDEAVTRAGTAGRRLALAVPVSTTLTVVMLVVFVVAVAVRPTPGDDTGIPDPRPDAAQPSAPGGPPMAALPR